MLKLGLQKMLANKSYLSYSPRMASGISTRYLGLLHTQPGGPSRLLARSCDATSSRLGFRGYATATVTKQKPPGPAKRTTRNAAVRSTSAASPKPSTQTVSAKTVPGSSKATGVVSDPAQPTGPATPGPVLTSGSTTYKVQEKSNQPLTEDEQMKQVDQILDMARLFPTADPWGQRVDTLGGLTYFECSIGILDSISLLTPRPRKKRRHNSSPCQSRNPQTFQQLARDA